MDDHMPALGLIATVRGAIRGVCITPSTDGQPVQSYIVAVEVPGGTEARILAPESLLGPGLMKNDEMPLTVEVRPVAPFYGDGLDVRVVGVAEDACGRPQDGTSPLAHELKRRLLRIRRLACELGYMTADAYLCAAMDNKDDAPACITAAREDLKGITTHLQGMLNVAKERS